MTEQPPSPIGTVAQEAARLIEEMTAMARSSYSARDEPTRYAGERVEEPVVPEARHTAPAANGHAANGHAGEDQGGEGQAAGGHRARDHQGPPDPADHVCSACGAERDDARSDNTPSTCKLCPLCRGIALFRSVRPETVDLLADLALSVAATLRDVATRSRAADPATYARSTPGRPSGPDRASIQDIQVEDDSEG